MRPAAGWIARAAAVQPSTTSSVQWRRPTEKLQKFQAYGHLRGKPRDAQRPLGDASDSSEAAFAVVSALREWSGSSARGLQDEDFERDSRAA